MNARQYTQLTAPLRRRPGLCSALRTTNRLTTALVYAVYILYALWLLLHRDSRLAPTLLVPAVFFLLVSVWRDRINAPRPYEILDIDPIIHKNTRGHSFPSRHVFSVFIIATTIGTQVLWLGAALGVVGIVIGIIRVLGGVHFPKDVIVGLLLGVACGLLGCGVWNALI
ncbi:MAG: phosphatase PAP2 family protein [Butyricicoccus sp.]